MTITVQYFAALRERRGLSQETIETEALTPAALYDELRDKHDLKLEAQWVRFAVGEDFIEPDTPLKEGDVLTLIPPVAGG